MPTYDTNMKRTASNAASVGSITGGGSRRAWIWDLVFSSEAAPADNEFLFRMDRCAAGAGTGTAVTAIARDSADPAVTAVVKENMTIEPTYPGNQEALEFGLNSRAVFRWQVDPTNGLVMPAAAGAGFGFKTPSPSPASLVTINMAFNE